MRWPERDAAAALPAGDAGPFELGAPARRADAERRACASAPSARSGPRPRSSSRRRCSSSRRSSAAELSPGRRRAPRRRARQTVVGRRRTATSVAARRSSLRARRARRAPSSSRPARRRPSRTRSTAAPVEVAAAHDPASSPTVGYAEPWWIQIIKALVIFAVGLQIVPIVLLAERKLLGRFQGRYGPNRVGPFGALQPLADIVKLLDQGAVPPAHVGRLPVRARAGRSRSSPRSRRSRSSRSATPRHLRHAGRPLRHRRRRSASLYVFAFGAIAFYGADARRLGVGLEVLVPRRDARRRAADLLRGRAGPVARRRGHDRAARCR